MARYSLDSVFNSPQKELAKFKSRRQTSSEFSIIVNSLAVLKDEETVIGVLNHSGGSIIVSESIKYKQYHQVCK